MNISFLISFVQVATRVRLIKTAPNSIRFDLINIKSILIDCTKLDIDTKEKAEEMRKIKKEEKIGSNIST